MEAPNQEEAEMPIPLNSTYGHLHGHPIIHHHHNDHHHHHPSSSSSPPPHQIVIPPMDDDNNNNNHHNNVIVPFKRPTVIRYRECLKNHAASMGGNANDGCGEFMPSGDDGTLESLTCSACSCHRNFHRKEIDGGDNTSSFYTDSNRTRSKLYVGHHPLQIGYHRHHHHSRPVPPHQMIMSYNMGSGGGGSLPSESDEQDGGGGGGGGVVRPPQMLKKRFRTKFSQEQKEKMLGFAERVGWKIQKQEEGVVQSFCQEIGVKRRVLKVWMHNNKHSLAKKSANDQSVNHGGDDHGDQNQV